MRLIFLDIDGVLNSEQFLSRAGTSLRFDEDQIDPAAVLILDELVRRSAARLVLSSAWRMIVELDKMEEILRGKGYKGSGFIGKTPNCARLVGIHHDKICEGERGLEIQEFLDSLVAVGQEIENFVIIDDSSDMAHLLPSLYKTNWRTGLLMSDVEPILTMLSPVDKLSSSS